MFCFDRDDAGAVGTPETGAARAGRVAAARACKGPAVRRMQSKRDETSVPLMKSSKNYTQTTGTISVTLKKESNNKVEVKGTFV